MRRGLPGSDLSELSWVFNGYTIAFTAALLPAGGLADRFGYARIYLAGLAAFVVSAAVCAAAPTVGVLVAARLVQGAGGGIITPLTLALILPHFPSARRATAIGLWSAAQSVATASGPAVGGALVAVWDWRTIFLLHVPVGLVVMAGAWWTLPRGGHAGGASGDLGGGAGDAVTGAGGTAGRGVGAAATGRLPDLGGLTLLVAAIGLPALAIVRGDAWGPADPRTAGVLVTGIAAGALFVRRTVRHPAPIVDLGVLRAPGTGRANAAMVLVGVVMFALTLANVLFLVEVWDYTEARAGLAITPAPLAHALAAPLSGRLIGRYGHRAGALAGVVLLASATLTLALGTGVQAGGGTARAYGAVVLPALVASGAGVALLVTSLSGAAIAAVEPGRMATGTALSVTSRACGAVIGLSALALLLSSTSSDSAAAYRGVWWAMTGICVLIAVAVAGLRPGGRRTT
jgi:MFS family permease